jgi:hypothetical protein
MLHCGRSLDITLSTPAQYFFFEHTLKRRQYAVSKTVFEVGCSENKEYSGEGNGYQSAVTLRLVIFPHIRHSLYELQVMSYLNSAPDVGLDYYSKLHDCYKVSERLYLCQIATAVEYAVRKSHAFLKSRFV